MIVPIIQVLILDKYMLVDEVTESIIRKCGIAVKLKMCFGTTHVMASEFAGLLYAIMLL